MPPFRQTTKSTKSVNVKMGSREIIIQGLTSGFWTDLYHRSMTVAWPVFFASAALIFITLNSTYALLFFLGDQPIANAPPGNFADLFFFSIETLATVGYGDMHPQTYYGHLVATVEIFTGMSFMAVMTGLIFARFSRPRPRLMFAEQAIVAMHDGQPTLMIRVANARHNLLSDAVATLWLLRTIETREGRALRRYYPLELQRRENPVFAMSWTIFHSIDESSPLFGLSGEDLAAADAALVLTTGGVDDASAQPMRARKSYGHGDIRWWHRYVDIMTVGTDGRLFIDYGRFHDVTPDEADAAPGALDGDPAGRASEHPADRGASVARQRTRRPGR
ncbi:MAG TPA: ion channel [Xanthobacteraceae bacterium]|nr:ion channel [Xanthobacteraceae bacterium]